MLVNTWPRTIRNEPMELFLIQFRDGQMYLLLAKSITEAKLDAKSKATKTNPVASVIDMQPTDEELEQCPKSE